MITYANTYFVSSKATDVYKCLNFTGAGSHSITDSYLDYARHTPDSSVNTSTFVIGGFTTSGLPAYPWRYAYLSIPRGSYTQTGVVGNFKSYEYSVNSGVSWTVCWSHSAYDNHYDDPPIVPANSFGLTVPFSVSQVKIRFMQSGGSSDASDVTDVYIYVEPYGTRRTAKSSW